MSKPTEVPKYIVNNIVELLNQAGTEGCDIGMMPQLYFTTFNSSIYAERYGFKTWGEMLTTPLLQPHAVIFSNGQRVKSTKFGNPNQNNVQVLQPQVISAGGGSGGGLVNTSQISGPSYINLGGPANNNNSHAPSTSAPSIADQSVQSDTSESRKRAGGDYDMDVDLISESEASGITDLTHVTISSENQVRLQGERQAIKWIAREVGAQHLDFNTLILERELKNAEPAMYIDCTFCDREVLEKLMDVKALVKKVSAQKFNDVRNKHNQFEFEKGSIFQHGSAIKMANVDALMGYALSNPKNPDGSTMLGPNELLYFADVNGGPGGHAEYFLWKKKWQAKGFGITPRGHDEYKFEQAEHFPRESFETFYGESGTEGAGNIARPIILSKFITFVKQSTDERGVHFMIGSSGDADDSADEDQKEIRCKYHFLAQLLLALKIVRQGGHYVTRIYDMYTPFTVGLIYLMYRCFEQVAVFKPESSLPASSEKYIICKWRKPDSQCMEIANYLGECHKVDWLTRRNTKRGQENFAEIVHLMNPTRLTESYRFYQYIRSANVELGKRQIHETSTLVHNIRSNNHTMYIERRLQQIQTKCLQLWGVPQKVREKPKYSKATTPKIRGMKLLTPYQHDFFSKTESEGEVALFTSNIATELKRPKEWRFMTVGKERGFFLCLGGSKIYKFNKGNWDKVKESMELMNNTLVYADLVDELYISGAKQSSLTALHIIDALVLGSKDVRQLPYNERYELIMKYSASLNKLSRDDLAPIRAKPSHELTVPNMQKFLKKVQPFRNRGSGGELICPVDWNRPMEAHCIPHGVLFFKVLKENFSSVDFRFCLQNRVFWQLHSGIDYTVPDDIQNYTPKVGVVKLDENGEEKPLIHASNMLCHLTNPPQD